MKKTLALLFILAASTSAFAGSSSEGRRAIYPACLSFSADGLANGGAADGKDTRACNVVAASEGKHAKVQENGCPAGTKLVRTVQPLSDCATSIAQ